MEASDFCAGGYADRWELAMDDRVNFLIQAVCGEESYVLFDEMVQIGVPAADVFIDQQEQLHIILRDVRTAKYRVTDFVYDAENKKFIGKDALNEDAINYIGTTGRQAFISRKRRKKELIGTEWKEI